MTASGDSPLRSWVGAANQPDADFPIQNLPFGVFRGGAGKGDPAIGVAIGDRVLDVGACARAGLLHGIGAGARDACLQPSLNALMALGRDAARSLRSALMELLEAGNAAAERRSAHLAPAMSSVELLLPARIGGFTDFYASIHHATNVGSMLRPENPLLPNYHWVPIGYHGRASSIVVSGTAVRRPSGQTRDDAGAPPEFGPSRRLDYELELGVYVGAGNQMGQRLTIEQAEQSMWGVCLLNDWSARDIQAWEYQPLGPFLSKNFATSVSPWVVTLDALEPFRVPAAPRAGDAPAPLPYLSGQENALRGGLDLTLEVWLQSESMRRKGVAPMLVSRGSFSTMYWTLAQLLTHHASSGCNLQPGDLIGSGTVSGPTVESRGCLLERTWRGTQPLTLPDGEQRAFLEDGDEVILKGYAGREGERRLGLGECRGRITAALRPA